MSRNSAQIKIVNLEQGMPTVEQARLRMEYELQTARKDGYAAVKLIHGYGSSGAGGVLRTELQKELRRLVEKGAIAEFIAGENWRVSDVGTWTLLKRFPKWKEDRDFGKANKGISVVVF
jgi:hypothetical protein